MGKGGQSNVSWKVFYGLAVTLCGNTNPGLCLSFSVTSSPCCDPHQEFGPSSHFDVALLAGALENQNSTEVFFGPKISPT